MALEIQIGADNSEFKKKIQEVEFDIKELSKAKIDQIKLGLDTKEIDGQIKDAKKSLSDLKSALKDSGNAFSGATPKIANAGNTLTQFSRIAQDAPFGIMGIGNNLTATAEAFAGLTRDAGGAGNALKAVGASLMGPGGILLAVSLVTTALTVMSQKGITVGDVFNKLTGNFDEFGGELKKANQEAAKNAAEQVASVGSYVSAAKDIKLSMQERLIAVKKLQDEYPAFFGNLKKEEILNGNVANAVRDVTEALKAQARAKVYAGKLGDLAAKEVDLRDQEAIKIKEVNDQIAKVNAEKKKSAGFSLLGNQANIAAANLHAFRAQLKDIQDAIRANAAEMDKWAKKSTIEVKASIKLEFEPEKAKKVKELHPAIDQLNQLTKAGLTMPTKGIFDPLTDAMEASRENFINRLQHQFQPMSRAVMDFNKGMSDILKQGFIDTFSGIGEAIGNALANGGNVLQSIGASIIGSMGSVLSAIGDKMIALGAAAILTFTTLKFFGSELGLGPALATIAGGVALKAGGALLSSKSQQIGSGASGGGTKLSAGNSVSAPTSSTNYTSSSGGFQNVVFEISGQSLVGVLSNTLNKNVKLGGVPAI